MSTDTTESSDSPNVLVIMCDQLRGSALSCAGDPNVETPNIDRLAREGVRFTDACSTFPVCVPARFSIMTGRYPHSRYVPAIDYRLSPAEYTLADAFTEAGYETSYIGKWHLAGIHRFVHDEEDIDTGEMVGRIPIPDGQRGGFEHWRGFELRNDPFDTYYFADGDPEPRRIDGYQTDGLFDLAAEFVGEERDTDRPFFQILSVEPPHPPLTAPRDYLERWQGRELELRPNVDREASYGTWDGDDDLRAELGMRGGLLDELRAYYAMVENLDDNVGRLLDSLEDEGLREDTVVVFLSDHGSQFGSHGQRGKEDPYEESIHIPFIVSHPGGEILTDHTVDEPICTEDCFPTLCALAGVTPASTMDGVDLTPLARGDSETVDRSGVLIEHVAEHRPWMPHAEAPWRGIRTDRYKYVVKGGPRGGDPWLLYDLEDDPYEEENLVDEPDYQDVAARLHETLRDRLAETDDTYTVKPAFGSEGLNIWNGGGHH